MLTSQRLVVGLRVRYDMVRVKTRGWAPGQVEGYDMITSQGLEVGLWVRYDIWYESSREVGAWGRYSIRYDTIRYDMKEEERRGESGMYIWYVYVYIFFCFVFWAGQNRCKTIRFFLSVFRVLSRFPHLLLLSSLFFSLLFSFWSSAKLQLRSLYHGKTSPSPSPSPFLLRAYSSLCLFQSSPLFVIRLSFSACAGSWPEEAS